MAHTPRRGLTNNIFSALWLCVYSVVCVNPVLILSDGLVMPSYDNVLLHRGQMS